MANDLNHADKLLERILLDAREEAEKTAADMQEEVSRAKELADHGKWEIQQDAKARGEKLTQDILERSRTNAELDSRKYALKAKREVISEAFGAAYRSLCSLSGAEREELLLSAALREADGGEKLHPAKADAALFSALLPRVNGALQKAGKAPLTLESSRDIDGGFILEGDGYEKNCSFTAMLREVREREESRVSSILFQ